MRPRSGRADAAVWRRRRGVRESLGSASVLAAGVIAFSSCAIKPSRVSHPLLTEDVPVAARTYRAAGVLELDFETQELHASPNDDPWSGRDATMTYCLKGSVAKLEEAIGAGKGGHWGVCRLVVRYLSDKGATSDCPFGDLEIVKVEMVQPVSSEDLFGSKQ